MCINDMENHNSNALAFQFDARGKGVYGGWRAVVDIVVRWIRVGVQGRWKMEAGDGGQMGHPSLFPSCSLQNMDLLLPN